MRFVYWLAISALVAALLGCGGTSEAETASTEPRKPASEAKVMREESAGADVWVSLDGRVGAEDAGILIAKEREYFADLGLRVDFGAPARPRRPVQYVSNRTADLALSQQPEVVLAKAKGAPVIAVGSLLTRPTLSLIWLPGSHIDDLSDLRGKTIGVPGIPYQERFLQFLLARAGLSRRDVHVKIVGYDVVRTLESGRADAIFGSSNLEGAVLAERGLNPVIMPIRRLGIPDYDELVVIVRSRRVARHPRLVRKFMAAVARGTAAASADPEAVARAIGANTERGYGLSPEDIEAEVEATLPLLARAPYIGHSRTKHLVDWMRKQGLIQRPLPISELLSTDYQR
jgi:putative hydroxymethylpyrimidine transport system substrate-binding protein